MIGTWITLSDPAVSEILASMEPFDFIVVDRQHSSMTSQDMVNHIRAIDITDWHDRADCMPYVRVRENRPAEIMEALDAGASGVVVPNVDTPNAAFKAANAASYWKSRGMGLWRSNHYGRWIRQGKREVIVQIESRMAVDNLEEIVATEGVNGFLVGMYDLSASCGHAGNFATDKFLDAMATIEDFAKDWARYGGFQEPAHYAGVHVPLAQDTQKVKNFIDIGFNWMVYGMDTSFLWDGLETKAEELEKYERSHRDGS